MTASEPLAVAPAGPRYRRGGLRRRLFLASAIIFGAIVVVEGVALVGLERLDGLLTDMQREQVADARRMLDLTESTSNLMLAARRFRDVERRIAASGRDMKSCTLEELDREWDAVKAGERA